MTSVFLLVLLACLQLCAALSIQITDDEEGHSRFSHLISIPEIEDADFTGASRRNEISQEIGMALRELLDVGSLLQQFKLGIWSQVTDFLVHFFSRFSELEYVPITESSLTDVKRIQMLRRQLNDQVYKAIKITSKPWGNTELLLTLTDLKELEYLLNSLTNFSLPPFYKDPRREVEQKNLIQRLLLVRRFLNWKASFCGIVMSPEDPTEVLKELWSTSQENAIKPKGKPLGELDHDVLSSPLVHTSGSNKLLSSLASAPLSPPTELLNLELYDEEVNKAIQLLKAKTKSVGAKRTLQSSPEAQAQASKNRIKFASTRTPTENMDWISDYLDEKRKEQFRPKQDEVNEYG